MQIIYFVTETYEITNKKSFVTQIDLRVSKVMERNAADRICGMNGKIEYIAPPVLKSTGIDF